MHKPPVHPDPRSKPSASTHASGTTQRPSPTLSEPDAKTRGAVPAASSRAGSARGSSPADGSRASSTTGPAGSVVDASEDGEDEGDMAPQALDIMAGLASLGISDALRSRVQDALAELERASSAAPFATPHASGPDGGSGAASTSGRGADGGKGGGGAGGGRGAAGGAKDLKLSASEHKLQMSRSIMRKLYHKNVALEKELAVLKAGQQPLVLGDPWGAPPWSGGQPPAALGTAQSERPSTAYMTNGQLSPVAIALQERDQTIQQLQAALDAARRRCALLEDGLAMAGEAGGPAGGSKGYSQESVRQVLAQSTMHFNKYKAIREDYNRLLTRRAGALQGARGTTTSSAAVRHVVGDLQQRLHSEVAEREAEAALYSARLYESERQLSDWYVEKRMLQDQIAKLGQDARERDRLDSEIEGCVCGLFERLRLLETANEELLLRLGEGGGGAAPCGQQLAAQGMGSGAANVLTVRH